MIIFDLDDTLVDTSKIKKYRRVNWTRCCELIPTETELNISLETIKKLKNKYRIAVVTNSPKFYAEKVLGNNGVEADVLISYRDTRNHKPHPEPMLLAAKRMHTQPKDCIAIGDHINDILASSRAGMLSIGVTWGEHSLEHFKEIGCLNLFSRKQDLENYLLTLI